MGSEDIFTRMVKGLENSEFSRRKFLPHDTFDKLLTRGVVEEEMHKVNCECKSVFLDFVMNHSRKVFAILVYSGHVKRASNLLKYKFMDKHLPVLREDNRVTSFNLLADDVALEWFRSWTEGGGQTAQNLSQDLVAFDNAQWTFLAPVFTKQSIMEQPHDLCPLPFLKYEMGGGGSFSSLYKGRIHKAHTECADEASHCSANSIYCLTFLLDNAIAVKQLNDSNVTDKAYEVEINALELARRLDHPHLVKFIAGFEQEQRRYLMFRWVDGRDLEEFWKTHKWERGENIIRWALEQSKGLAEGLEKLHNFDLQRNCRHGDLKPNNIVRSLNPGKFGHLQIADMGLAKVHSLPTSLRRVGTTSLEGAIRYQPPEVKTSISGKRSRSYDIWSMGCILLEFIIWLLLGKRGRDEFNASFEDAFFVIHENGPLHPSINEWIKHLRTTCLGDSDETCVSQALKGLLRHLCSSLLVEDAEPEEDPEAQVWEANERPDNADHLAPRFLVTPATKRTSLPSRKRRGTIKDLCKELQEICSNQNPNYFYNESTAKEENTMQILEKHTLKNLNLPVPTGARPQLQIANTQACIQSLINTWMHQTANSRLVILFRM
jgi:serine/threonine protein kinase